MKLFCYLCLLLLSSFLIYGREFEKSPLRIDFTQLEVKNETIIAYGNKGMIQISHDDGYSWKKVSVFDQEIISKVIIGSNSFFAFGITGKVAVSSDNGYNWQTIFRFKDSTFAVKEVPDGYLVRSNCNIFVCDSNFHTK